MLEFLSSCKSVSVCVLPFSRILLLDRFEIQPCMRTAWEELGVCAARKHSAYFFGVWCFFVPKKPPSPGGKHQNPACVQCDAVLHKCPHLQPCASVFVVCSRAGDTDTSRGGFGGRHASWPLGRGQGSEGARESLLGTLTSIFGGSRNDNFHNRLSRVSLISCKTWCGDVEGTFIARTERRVRVRGGSGSRALV